MRRALLFVVTLGLMGVSRPAAAHSCDSPQENSASARAVVATPDGFVVAWSYSFESTGERGLRVQRLDPTGTPIGSPHTWAADDVSQIALSASGIARTTPGPGRVVRVSRTLDDSAPVEVFVPGTSHLPTVRTATEWLATSDKYELVAIDDAGTVRARTEQPRLAGMFEPSGFNRPVTSSAMAVIGSGVVVAVRTTDELRIARLAHDGTKLFCGANECSDTNEPFKANIGIMMEPAAWVSVDAFDDGAIVLAGAEGGIEVATISADGTVVRRPRLAVPATYAFDSPARASVRPSLGRPVLFGHNYAVPLTPDGAFAGPLETDGKRTAALACGHGRCLTMTANGVLQILDEGGRVVATHPYESVPAAPASKCDDDDDAVFPHIGCATAQPRSTESSAPLLLALVAVLALVVARRRVSG